MPSRYDSHFQPLPPLRTATSGSQKSNSSGTASPDMLSPTSTSTRRSGFRSTTSPTEDTFFGAISSKIRGRSHSRNRSGAARKRSKSPMVMPPEHFPPTSNAHPMAAAYAPQRPKQSRHKSTASQSSTMSMPAPPTRTSMQGPTRRNTNNSDMWRGRHSNSWLFNDFSVTEHAKDILHFGRKS